MRNLLIILFVWCFFGVYIYPAYPHLIDLILTTTGLLVATLLWLYHETKITGILALIAIMPDFLTNLSPLFGVIQTTFSSIILTAIVLTIAFFPNNRINDRIY